MNILINYANNIFRVSQKKNNKTGLDIGGFDQVWSYTPKHIDKNFYRKNSKILDMVRGNGYFLWKPYFIHQALKKITNDDFLFYSDSGTYFIAPIDPLVKICRNTGQDIIPFDLPCLENYWRMPYVERYWTKRDAFILMDCDTPRYTDTCQRLASYSLWRKSEFSINFCKEWLEYGQDYRIITDSENEMGKPNYDGFQENRHDQTIFSLLTKKYELKAYRDPSQLGNSIIGQDEDSPYGQIIEHTRMRHYSIPQRIINKCKRIINRFLGSV